MNDIKELIIKILEESPQIAIWVLVIIYGYKVAIVGSIFAIIRHVTNTVYKTIIDYKEKPKQVTFKGILINYAAESRLTELLCMMKNKSDYVHASDIDKVIKLINEDREKNLL